LESGALQQGGHGGGIIDRIRQGRGFLVAGITYDQGDTLLCNRWKTRERDQQKHGCYQFRREKPLTAHDVAPERRP